MRGKKLFKKEGSSLIDIYFKDLGKIKIVTLEEELAMREKIKELRGQNTPEAENELIKIRNSLVESCLRLAYSKAARCINSKAGLEELLQVANECLIAAFKRYDPGKGVRFSTFALTCVDNGIMRYLNEETKMIRLPQNVVKNLRRKEFWEIECETKDDNIISEKMGISKKKLEYLKNIIQCNNSLEEMVYDNEENGKLLKDNLRDSKAVDPMDNFIREYYAENIRNIMKKVLNEREIKVLNMMYGIGEKSMTSMTYREIGKKLGVSGERVRQIMIKVFEKLKKSEDLLRLRAA